MKLDIKRRCLKRSPEMGTGMAAPRKIFRIEESGHIIARGAASTPPVDDEAALRHHEVMTALTVLPALIEQRTQLTPETIASGREQIAQAHELKIELDLIHEAIRRTKQDIGGLEVNAFIGPQMARVGRELDAVIAGTEQATQ